MLKRKLLAFAAVLCLALPSFGFEVADIEFADCTVAPPAAADCSAFIGTGAGQAKNVILMVGDGMGLTQVFAGRVKVNGPDKPLAWEQLPHRGLATTCSLTGITDSAASSTALHSGHKTENGRINTGPDNQRLENITDLIHARRAVGVVSTVRIWDATPAGATAHASLRSQDREIAAEMVRHDLQYQPLGRVTRCFARAIDQHRAERAGGATGRHHAGVAEHLVEEQRVAQRRQHPGRPALHNLTQCMPALP